MCFRPLILCQDEESRHASLASQWQGVIRATKIPVTLFFCLLCYSRFTTTHIHTHARTHVHMQHIQTFFFLMSRVPQFKSSQLQLRLPISICMTHSLNQMPDRQLLQTSVVSTLYESISHLFLVQFLDNINVTQMNSETWTYKHMLFI